ncbi:MAG: murein biosynthesis integral membrane protein MurJ [Corynebacteriales bacterium]|nr:murein biosynthesis integral membrane protein MurJ [Mycobacteriales bacterium]
MTADTMTADSPVSEPTPTPPPPGKDGSLARNSAVMAIGSLVSRASGFIRTAVIGAALSGAIIGDSYQVANTLPNMVYELLLGGVLASVVVPLIVKARKTDEDGGVAFVHRLLTLATVLLAAATMVALLAAPLLTQLIISDAGGEQQRLVTWMAYLLLPEIFFYGIAAMLGAVLNTRGHFAAPMWSPIVNNIVVIGTAIVFMLMPGPAIPTLESITAAQVMVLGVGTTLGVVAQTLALWPALRRVGFRWRWRFDFANARLGEASRLAGWMLCYVAVSQVGLFVVMALASRAGERGGPGPFIHNNAFLLFMMVHGIVAVSIITALLPRMSASAVEGKYDEVSEQLSLGTRLSAVVLVPATAAYIALGVPLAVTAFQWGGFTQEQAGETGLATVAAATGLVPFAISQLQIFAFYAMRDTRTPALANIPVIAVKVVVSIGLYMILPPKYVVAGLMIANTLSAVAAVLLGAWLLRKRIGRLGLNLILQTLTRLSMAAVFAGIIGWGIAYGVMTVLGDEKLGSFVALVVGGGALIGAFLAGAVFLRVKEISEVGATLRAKLPARFR